MVKLNTAKQSSLKKQKNHAKLLREEALSAHKDGKIKKAVDLAEALNHDPYDQINLLSYGTLTAGSGRVADFCQKALTYLDKFPDNKPIRVMLIKTQSDHWHNLIAISPRSTLSSNPSHPLVTIIVTNFSENQAKLNKTLMSIATATPDLPLEIEIINFSATPNADLITQPEFNHNLTINCLSPASDEQPSLALAVNLGMSLGIGRYCLALNTGDHLGNIVPLVNKLESDPRFAVAYGNSLLESSDDELRKSGIQKVGDFFLLELTPTTFNHLKHNYSVGPHPLWRRELCHEIGFWDLRQTAQSAQDFWLRVSRKKKLAYLPIITGKSMINSKYEQKIPMDLKQDPILVSRYRSTSSAKPTAAAQRCEDILNYANNDVKGLVRFLKDLTNYIQNGHYLEALDLYDRIRWDMPPSSELGQIDKSINNIRRTAFSKSPTQETDKQTDSVTKLLQEADQAIANGNDHKAFMLLIKIKDFKKPIMNIDYRRAEIFIRKHQPLTAKQALLDELRYFPNNDKAVTLLEQLDKDFPSHLETSLGDQYFKDIYQQIRPYAMLSEQRLHTIYKHAKKICEDDIPGNFIECGVAAGGSSALLAAVIKRYSKQTRYLFAFDSFSGMPKPVKHDTTGDVNAEDTGWNTNTRSDPEESIEKICSHLGVSKLVVIVKGSFAETLPSYHNRVGMIAFLHLNDDWHGSTMVILESFYNRVVTGGILQVVDYGHWAGCRKAVHKFADSHKLSFEINTIDGTGIWIEKKEAFPVNPAIDEKLVTDFNKVESGSRGVTSQMSTNERFQLFYTVSQLVTLDTNRPLNFIEIGSFSGASLLLFYFTLKQKGITFSGYSVEPYGTQQFATIVNQLRPEITHLKAFSDKAVVELKDIFDKDNNRPQFIFVDGDHRYAGVYKDIENYYPLLAPGGYMIFHDFLPELNDLNRGAILSQHGGQEPGIRQACCELMEEKYGCQALVIPLLYPDDPTQTQAYLPIIPDVFSTLRVYRKALQD